MAQLTSSLAFVTVDVFTKQKYIGNPLAIVYLPPDINITQDQKQLIAREFNLSETVFLHLPSSPASAATDSHDATSTQHGKSNVTTFRKVDIFTPDTELPFAGHPTIGTACHVLSAVSQSDADASGIVYGEFLTKAGKIPLQYDTTTHIARASIPHNVRIHQARYSLQRLLEVQPKLRPDSFYQENAADFPVVSIVNGMTFVLAQMKDLDAIKPPALIPLAARTRVQLDEGWERPEAWIYTWVRMADSEDGTKNIRTRLMMEGGEDPATGSASCALTSYLALQEGKPGETVKYQITQGVEMGRKSDIGVEIKLSHDGKVEAVYLSGSAVQVMEGKVTL